MAVIINDMEIVAGESPEAVTEEEMESADTQAPGTGRALMPLEMSLVLDQQDRRAARVLAH